MKKSKNQVEKEAKECKQIFSDSIKEKDLEEPDGFSFEYVKQCKFCQQYKIVSTPGCHGKSITIYIICGCGRYIKFLIPPK